MNEWMDELLETAMLTEGRATWWWWWWWCWCCSLPWERVARVMHNACEVVRFAEWIHLARRYRVEIVLLTYKKIASYAFKPLTFDPNYINTAHASAHKKICWLNSENAIAKRAYLVNILKILKFTCTITIPKRHNGPAHDTTLNWSITPTLSHSRLS